jgi:hypothetical protein
VKSLLAFTLICALLTARYGRIASDAVDYWFQLRAEPQDIRRDLESDETKKEFDQLWERGKTKHPSGGRGII